MRTFLSTECSTVSLTVTVRQTTIHSKDFEKKGKSKTTAKSNAK